ncbi:MAG TPA: FlgD immunoglobulin-like domain containing protein, partial [Burkholderiaceae bacterium]|nr:FlgD immunoglobulin-like domain containing protein [Burkholderiaceae bacterium]
LSLSGTADSVKVEILGSGEQILGTVDLGSLKSGMHNFNWNAAGVPESSVKGFRVVATNGGKNVAAEPLARQRVESVAMVDGAMRLRTDAGTTLSYDQILAFM